MTTKHFHEHTELAGETEYRITVVMNELRANDYLCEMILCNRDTTKIPSIFGVKLVSCGYGKTAKNAYNNAYRQLRNHNRTAIL